MTDMTDANELDALLEGVEAPSGVLAEQVLESLSAEDDAEQVPGGVDDDAELAALDGDPSPPQIDKQAIYEEQDSKIGVADEEEAAPKKGKRGRKKKAAGAAAAAKPPKAPKNTKSNTADGSGDAVVLTRSQAFLKKASGDDLMKLGYGPDEIADIYFAMDNAPKKVAEKAYNLLRFAVGREHLSNYSLFAFQQIHANPGMSVPQLVKAMEDRGYKSGTARSQSQQMSRLFGLFGMINKAGSSMSLVDDSPLVSTITARLKADGKL